MKRISLFLGISAFLFCSCNNASNAQNIALGKSYTISSNANYALTSADADHKLLTDGVYTSGYFWTSKTTVGWQYNKRVNIEIDLSQISTIDEVTFNTVRGNNAGVQFPSNIFVFTSKDKMIYSYVGDAAADPDNVPGTYEVKKFTLKGINKIARYIQFVVIPNGSYFFCDEIEVLASHNLNKNTSKNQVYVTNVNASVDSLQRIKSDSKKAAYQLNRIRASFNNPNSNTADLKMSNTSLQGTNLMNSLAEAKLERLSSLRLKYGNKVLIDKISPWDILSAPYQPQNNDIKNFNIITIIDGVQYGAFIITNLSNSTQLFDCSFDSGNNNISSNELFIVPFVTSGNKFSEVADPLINPGKNKRIEPGESVVYLFKITGRKPGHMANGITIRSKSFSYKLLVDISVLNQGPIKEKYSLNADNWAYLTSPLIKDRQNLAIQDLLAHHINTIAVPPYIIPIIGSNNYSDFASYLSKLKPFSNIFLFMDLTSSGYKESFKQCAFMTDNWKANFNVWYAGIVRSAISVGISPSKIFLYPYDEVHSEDIQQYSVFLKWLKAEHPDIRTFSTLSTKPAIDALMPLLTISQVSNIGDLIPGVETGKYNNVWLYDTQANAELLSPYSYYRLMAWKAFFYGYKGVGFWNYADYRNGSTNKVDINNFDGVNATNYSVIYNAPDKGLVSSRRWEAFRLGIEDYELLKMYAEKNGSSKAKQLAEIVVNNPDNVNKADLIRNQILQSLFK